MADDRRREELRRRIEKDPASIVFAQLAEEHRRAGEFEDAIRVCRAGLVHHPGYFSARVTLGRALMETGSLEDAQSEFEYVLGAAPHNLGATRALDELRQKREAGRLPTPGLPIASYPVPHSPVFDPVLIELESWLAAIVSDRQRRSA